MTQRGDLFLCLNDCAADGALGARRQAGLGAGSCLAGDSLLLVTQRGDFLRLGLTAPLVGAGVGHNTLVLAGRRSGDLAGVPVVAGRRDFFHTGENRLTNGALRTGRMTSLGAGSGLFRNFNRSMSSRVDCFGLGCIANCAGVGLDTGVLTGRRGRDLALIPAVPLGWNLCLCNDDLIADRAADAIRQTRFGAGRRLAHNGLLGVAGRGDFLRLGLVADRAGESLDTVVQTGRSGRDLAFTPLVTGGGDFGLRRKNIAADGALGAIRQTLFGAGRRLARNGFFLVAGRGNHFLRNENFVADGAVLTLSLAGFRAGRLNGSINGLDMALSLNGLALDDFFAADGADRIAGVAVLSAGGILLVDHLGERMIVLPLGVEGGVLGQINSRTIRIGVASTIGRRIPVQEVVALAGEGVCIQRGIGLRIYGLRGHRAFDRVFRTAVGFKGNRQLDRLFAAPDATDIVDGVASLGVLRLDIGAVGVVQLGGGDGDGHCTIAICIILIRLGLRAECALLNVLAGAVAGADIRTTPGGIDSTNRRYAAVYIHLRINQVVIGAVVCLTRRIGHGLKLAGAPDKVVGVPLIAVIEIDILSVCNCQASAFGNVDLNARQQSRVLIDGHISGLDIDGDVIGDGQHIACRVDTHARKL